MGTRFEIVIASADESVARPIAEEALYEIEELHHQLNRFASDSLLSFINRSAGLKPVRLDRNLFQLFETAQQIRQQSEHAFDIALGTGSFVLDPAQQSIRFSEARVELDLGGIAKGYALDRAAAMLRAQGVTSALLHGGTSSVVAIGAPPDAAAWRVAVAHTANLTLELYDRSLSVSRPHAQTVQGHAHIIDPRTRAPLTSRTVAVVTGPSAIKTEGWSTALAVLGYRPAALDAEYETWIAAEHDAE